MSTPTFAKTHNLIAFLKKASESDGFEQIVDFLNANQIKYALAVSPIIYITCIKQFWTTLMLKTVNDDVRLQALIDGKKVVITEACIRHNLKLNDAEGTSCLTNAVIFEELERMGAKTTSWNEFSSTMASAIICLANNQKFNFSKYILDNLEADVPFYMFPRFIQFFVNHQIGDMSHHKGIYVNPSLIKKVSANMKRVGTVFSGAVTPLFNTMMVQAVKEMGDKPTIVQDTPIPDAPSSSQPQRKHKRIRKERKETKVSPTELHTGDHVPTTSNDPLPSGEDSIKAYRAREQGGEVRREEQERKIADIDADAEVNLENVYNLDMAHEETVLSMQDITDVGGKEVAEEMVKVITTAKIIIDEVSTASGELSAANKEPIKDKGKAKLVEEPKVLKLRKAQIAIDEEVARRIEAEWNADMKDNIDWNEVVE
nr:hypothetical protein [Tanacetum cinerariifolium]